MDEKKVYTCEEVAKILKISPLTVRKMIKNGQINAIKLGIGTKAPIRISERELDRILAGGLETAGPDAKQVEKPLPEAATKPKKPKGS